jgi:leucine-rich repeat protein SHOC2
LPESIGQLTKLESLQLWEDRMRSLPESIGNLTNLKYLTCGGGNYIERLPESIGNLHNLETLSIRGSKLKNLPDSIGCFSSLTRLDFCSNSLKIIPESIENLINLKSLDLSRNQIESLTEIFSNFRNLVALDLGDNQLKVLPTSIEQLVNLDKLTIVGNQLTSLPASIGYLKNLTCIHLDNYPDLSILQSLPKLEQVRLQNIDLPRRYWTKLSDWQPQWLLDETNAEIRRLLIQQIGYDRICQELAAIEIDNWREYTLLKVAIDVMVSDENGNDIEEEPMMLLKMTCPSTAHVHILRVPPDMTSAEAAITWINHGIHPDDIAVQT